MSVPIFYLRDISLSFDKTPLFEGIDLQISNGDRICLVGSNGSGKSSLLKLMAGIYEADKGELYISPKVKLSFLPQSSEFKKDQTIYDFVLEGIKLSPGETLEEKKYLADVILDKLGIYGMKLMSKASGGKVRRAALAKALISDPDILLLDEPTNHLDINSVEWLEDYLSRFKGGIMMISHDREFLRRLSNKTIWLDRRKTLYNPNGFKDFDNWSQAAIEKEEKTLSRLSKEVDRENVWLSQGVTARRKRNQRRLSNLYVLREKLSSDKSRHLRVSKGIKLDSLAQNKTSKMVLELDQISHHFDDVSPPKVTIKPFSIRIIKNEVIGLMGRNGAGKTTLLNIITRKLAPTTGEVRYSPTTKVSYFDQKRESLDDSKTLWETLCPTGGDTVLVSGQNKHVIAYLKDFLFDSHQAKSMVGTLSGGQKNRLLLARILANPGNFLILDEPTNDLDMDTLDMLVDILSDYKGTLLIVSHDRDFLEKLVTRTLVMDGNGIIEDYIGGYKDIAIEKKAKQSKLVKEPAEKKTSSPKKLSYKYERELELIPEKIEKLIVENSELEKTLENQNLFQENPDTFSNAIKKLELNKSELEAFENRWLELEEMKQNLSN